MWLIGKNLKKRHHLKEDVRESFYDAVNFWLKALKAKGTTFMGGDQPGNKPYLILIINDVFSTLSENTIIFF